MAPRIYQPSRAIISLLRQKRPLRPSHSHHYATAAVLTTSSSSSSLPAHSLSKRPPPPPKKSYPPTQPPSHKPPQFRKSQLMRQYASLLRSTPLMLLFQFNSIKASEWIGLRRELKHALEKVDAAEQDTATGTAGPAVGEGVKLQVIQTGIFDAALKVVEFYRPVSGEGEVDDLTYVLSEKAHAAVVKTKRKHGLEPLLSGPVVLLTFPVVSPVHLKAALSIVAPQAPAFPAPTKKARPGYHEIGVQSAVQNLILMGARVEGKIFDAEGVRWVGGIEGGLDGLRAQVVGLLQSLGVSVTNTLESAGKNLYLTVEGRRTMMEEEGKGPEENKTETPS